MTKKQIQMRDGLIRWTGTSLARSDAGRDTGIHLEDVKPVLRICAVLLGAAWLMPTAEAATTNTVPWWDSFEAYTNGAVVSGTNGWTGTTGGAVVTNDAAVTDLLPIYPVSGKSYPLASATHTNVLKVTDETRNAVRSASNGVVKVELLALPTWIASPPAGDTNMQCNICVSTNARLTVWHHNITTATNEWRELNNSPSIASNAWSRFTIIADYAHAMFQVRVNEGDPITDSAGWASATGGLSGGAWFHMIQTNGLLAGLRVEGAPAYVDDVLITNRSLTWSGDGFTESVLNDGTLATNPAFTVTLTEDAFTGADGDDFVASGKAVTNGVPAGLTAVIRRISATQAAVTFTGAALQHESANSLSNLTIRFTDAAFGYSGAWDVSGYQRTNLTVTFLDTPRLTWSKIVFLEASTNTGSIDNSTPLLITLTNGTFAGVLSEDFGSNSAKLTYSNLPSGLSVEALLMSTTQVRMRLLGNAAAHAAINSLTNLGVVLHDAAFVTVPASSVFNVSTNLTVTFADPGVLTYATNVFTETAANNGAVSGTTLALTDKTFNATNGENLVSGKVTGVNVPAGVTLQVVVTDSQHATLSLSGNATSHAAVNSISTLGLTFTDAAFAGGNAAGVANAGRSDLQIHFNDQPVVSASPGVFLEVTANNGAIGNTVTITMTGNTAFTNAAWVANTHYTVSNVPDGLTFSLTYVDATHVTAALTGNAASHTAANNITNLRVTFLDAAFTTVAATNIAGHPFDLGVTYANAPVLTYSAAVFTEISGGVIDNRNPITITLTGDSFGGANSQDFVTAGWLTVANLPAGLTALVTRNSATQLTVTLSGRATSHGSVNNVANIGFTFQAGAFASAQANQVSGYQKTDLSIVFGDEAGFFSVMPYAESFEAYANGTPLHGTNGWTATYGATAAIVTNDAVVTSNLLTYLQTHVQLPIVGTHTQVLSVQSTVQAEIHSEAAAKVYLDYMTFPAPMMGAPPSPTNLQCAFYISTNSQLVIWHHVTGASPTNEWLTLASVSTIDTSRWLRLTIEQDYTHNLFQVRVNEGQPATDAQGWTAGGVSQPGSWFHMVQTNGSMSGFTFSGGGQTYLDDLTVQATLPGWLNVAGSVYFIR